MQQLLGTERSGGEHHPVGAEDGPAASPGCGGLDAEAAAGPGHDGGHGGHRPHRCPRLLGQVQVVLQQRVLGAVATPGHALAAVDAAGAIRADPAKVGVLLGHSRRAQVDPHRRRSERVAHPHPGCDVGHHAIGRGRPVVAGDPQHAGRLVVERGELTFPVGDVRPLRVVVERILGRVQRVGVVQRTSADAGPGEHHDVAQQRDPLHAEAPQRRRPEELP